MTFLIPLPLTLPLGSYFLEAPPTQQLKNLNGANFAKLPDSAFPLLPDPSRGHLPLQDYYKWI